MRFVRHLPAMSIAVGLTVGPALTVDAQQQQVPAPQEREAQEQREDVRHPADPERAFPAEEERPGEELLLNGELTQANEWVDKPILDQQGQEVGQLEDLAIDVTNGRVAYGVVRFNGQQQENGLFGIGNGQQQQQQQVQQDLGDGLYAVPWQAFEPALEEEALTLNVDLQQFDPAQSFEEGEWPDMTDEQWARQTHEQYGLQAYWEQQPQQEQMQPGQMGQQQQQQPGQQVGQQQQHQQQIEQALQQAGAEQQEAQQQAQELTQRIEQEQLSQQEIEQELRDALQQAGADEQQAQQEAQRLAQQLHQPQQQQPGRQVGQQQQHQQQIEQALQQAGAEQQEAQQQAQELTQRIEQEQLSQQEIEQELRDALQQAGADEQQAQQEAQRLAQQLEARPDEAVVHRDQRPEHVEPLDELIGREVNDPQDESLAEVHDLVIDLREGRIPYAVLSYGGILGFGQDLVAVPWQALQFDAEQEVFVLDATEEQLDRFAFEDDEWPNMTDEQWASQIHTEFGQEPYWEVYGYAAPGEEQPEMIEPGVQQIEQTLRQHMEQAGVPGEQAQQEAQRLAQQFQQERPDEQAATQQIQQALEQAGVDPAQAQQHASEAGREVSQQLEQLQPEQPMQPQPQQEEQPGQVY